MTRRTDEIEVTEEMIEAGEDALMTVLGYRLSSGPVPDSFMREAVVLIYRRMTAAAPRGQLS
jgi:hypothetical protein